jgi:Poly(R)-hydroxyalkanoic acid synthase subunit (PHA_synth_III_E)
VDERPVWRQFFDAWEQQFGPRLEEYVQTDEFAERMTAFQQMNRRTAEANEEASRQLLRAWNLPTASDLEKLSQQVADIDRRLQALSQRVDQSAPAPGPRKRQGSKTPAGVKAAAESREAAAKQAAAASAGEGTAKTTKATPARAAKSARSSAPSHNKADSHNKAGEA